MTRESDGRITLTMPVLVALLSACLAVGSGGAWFAGSHASAESVDLGLSARVAVVEEKARAMDDRLARMEQKIDVLLARK